MWRICQRDAGEHKASMVRGQLRVAVIGAQTEAADSPKAYTVYRTSVNYRGVCYHRLLRFSEFLRFSRKVTIEDGEPITAPFPRKLWTRKASLRSEVVEARQVLLNEYMQQICSLELSPRTEEHLLRLLQLGQHDRGSTATVISRGRLSKLSTATSLADPATVDEEVRESGEVCSPIEESSDVPLSTSTLEIRVAPMVVPIPDESNEQASGEFAAESGNGTDTDWLRSSLEGRGPRAGSLSGMPLTPIKRPLMRASDSLPPKKVVDFALTPENDEDNGPAFVFADSGASSTTSSPSPAHKYERAVLAQRARVSELLSGKLRIETA